MRRACDPGPVDDAPDDEAAGLEGGPLERLGARGDVEPVEVRAQGVIVERRAFPAHVGQPDRDAGGRPQPGVQLLTARSRTGSAAQEGAGPVHEQGARVARPADEETVGRGVREADESGNLDPLVGHHPHDQGGAEDDVHVAGLSAPATTWSHMASMDPPVKTVSVPGRVPPAAHMGTTSGSCAGTHAHARRASRCSTSHRRAGRPWTRSRRCRWPAPRTARGWPPPGRASNPWPPAPARGPSAGSPRHRACPGRHRPRRPAPGTGAGRPSKSP